MNFSLTDWSYILWLIFHGIIASDYVKNYLKTPLNLTETYTGEHLGLKAQAELSFTSVELHPINLPDIWHEAAQCWGEGEMMGEGQEAPNGLCCQQLVSDHTTWIHREERHCLSLCALVSFLSAPCLSRHPSLSSSTWQARGVSTRGGGGRGKTIMLGSHKSTGRNSQAIYYNSLSVYKCG